MADASKIKFPSNIGSFPRLMEITVKELKILNQVPITYDKGTINSSDTMNIVTGAIPNLVTGMQSAASNVENFANLEYEEEVKAIIHLPLPNNLSTDFQANWNGAPLSPLEYAIREWANNGKDWGVLFQAYGQRMALSGMSLFAKKAASKTGIGGSTVEAAGSSVLKGAGIIMNPYQQLLYSGPSFRTFSFDWVLSPSNAKEAESIREATWYLKKYMHTNSSTKDLFFTFPAFCEVKFINQSGKNASFLFAIRESAITRVSVNYERKFHKDGSSIATRLGLDLMESVILTQEDFGESYQTSSSGKLDLLSVSEMKGKSNPSK